MRRRASSHDNPTTRMRVSFAAAPTRSWAAARPPRRTSRRRSPHDRSPICTSSARRCSSGPGRDAIEQALRSLDEGLARLGPIVTLELEAIDLELRLNRHDAALARLDGITARAPRKDSWLARRGAILERAGRPDQARAAYRAALDSLTSQSERIQQTRASATLAEELRADIERLDRKLTVTSDRPKRSR